NYEEKYNFLLNLFEEIFKKYLFYYILKGKKCMKTNKIIIKISSYIVHIIKNQKLDLSFTIYTYCTFLDNYQ
ncbi:hypothetical protein, partial [Ligilactobacillus salivarius]|uniref:hypothetical protein n=1 Tax=Ligilactobacillus salivarius TaxID=1624 RepID=UPI0022E5A2F2